MLDISPEVNDLLKKCSWPGNIRELRNIAEKAVIYSTKTINTQIVSDLITVPIKVSQDDTEKYDSDEIIPLKEYKNKMEIKYLQKVLTLTNGSVTKAAEMLGIDRTYLYQKLNQHKIKYT